MKTGSSWILVAMKIQNCPSATHLPHDGWACGKVASIVGSNIHDGFFRPRSLEKLWKKWSETLESISALMVHLLECHWTYHCHRWSRDKLSQKSSATSALYIPFSRSHICPDNFSLATQDLSTWSPGTRWESNTVIYLISFHKMLIASRVRWKKGQIKNYKKIRLTNKVRPNVRQRAERPALEVNHCKSPVSASALAGLPWFARPHFPGWALCQDRFISFSHEAKGVAQVASVWIQSTS